MPDLSIVIPTCNRGGLLRQAVGSIRQNVACDVELILVDGASTDAETPATLKLARELFGDRARLIREDRREGFTRAANKGFRIATGRHVVWLNDDARVLPGSLDHAVEQLDRSPADVGLVALFHSMKASKSIAYQTARHGRDFKLMHVRGTLYANFGLGRRALFERLGFFDERYYFCGADPDFSLKVWSAGLKVVPAWQSLIDHEETDDARRAEDTPRGREDNERLFARWDLPPRNPHVNDFDPLRPCTLRGLKRRVADAA